nr:MAG: wsv390-like protein [Metapenaeus ensis nimavirus]
MEGMRGVQEIKISHAHDEIDGSCQKTQPDPTLSHAKFMRGGSTGVDYKKNLS